MQLDSGAMPAPTPRSLLPREHGAYGQIAMPLLAGLALGALGKGVIGQKRPASYRRLTFRRGFIHRARFGPDGQVVYSGTWDGKPMDIFTVRPESPQGRSLGLAPGEAEIDRLYRNALDDGHAHRRLADLLGGARGGDGDARKLERQSIPQQRGAAELEQPIRGFG